MTVYVDMDEVLNEMCPHFFYYGQKLGLIPEDQEFKYGDTYSLADTYFPHLSHDEGMECVDAIFRTKYFWLSIPIKTWAKEVVEQLNKNHQVYIVTTPWDDYSPCIEEKRAWVAKHLPFINIPRQMIFMKDKFLLSGDMSIMIEDNPLNIDLWHGDLTIIMDYPYNEVEVRDEIGAKSWLRVKDWYTIGEFFKSFDTSVQEALEVKRKWKRDPFLSMVESS